MTGALTLAPPCSVGGLTYTLSLSGTIITQFMESVAATGSLVRFEQDFGGVLLGFK